jgi:hypothetical protein
VGRASHQPLHPDGIWNLIAPCQRPAAHKAMPHSLTRSIIQKLTLHAMQAPVNAHIAPNGRQTAKRVLSVSVRRHDKSSLIEISLIGANAIQEQRSSTSLRIVPDLGSDSVLICRCFLAKTVSVKQLTRHWAFVKRTMASRRNSKGPSRTARCEEHACVHARSGGV